MELCVVLMLMHVMWLLLLMCVSQQGTEGEVMQEQQHVLWVVLTMTWQVCVQAMPMLGMDDTLVHVVYVVHVVHVLVYVVYVLVYAHVVVM